MHGPLSLFLGPAHTQDLMQDEAKGANRNTHVGDVERGKVAAFDGFLVGVVSIPSN